MSLVEQALKKMQSAKAAAAVPARPAPEPTAADTKTQRAPAAAVSVSVPPPPPARTLTLNYAGLRSQGLYPPEHELRQIAQQYRQIKRPIIGSALGHNAPKLPSGHIIMVASAMPGEGKTFTSINLALSMAREKDVRVLLVDADVPKPHISRIFGVEDEPGLLDALRDSTMDVESLILPTDVPSLSIMPAGRRSENATELLASARMGEVVRAYVLSRKADVSVSLSLATTFLERLLDGLAITGILVIAGFFAPLPAWGRHLVSVAGAIFLSASVATILVTAARPTVRSTRVMRNLPCSAIVEIF